MKDKEKSREIQFKEELVRKAKNGDTKAFSLLYAGVCKEMYKFALYMMKHTEDAEDAVSETVISAFENIAKLKNESSFKSWIFTILGNQCRKMWESVEIMHQRKRHQKLGTNRTMSSILM